MGEIKLCDYGCGQQATHQFGNGKWCCSKYFSSCPEFKRYKTQKRPQLIRINTTKLCDYGCERPAMYQFGNGKWCCSERTSSCPELKNRLRIKKSKKTKRSKPIEIITIENCFYGCGSIAKFKFKNGKLCCSDRITKCLGSKDRVDKTWMNMSLEERFGKENAEFRKKSHALKIENIWEDPNSIYNTDEYREKLKQPKGSLEEQRGIEKANMIKLSLSLQMKEMWDDPNSVYNSEEYRNKHRVPKGSWEETMGHEKAEIRKNNLKNSQIFISMGKVDINKNESLYTTKARNKEFRLKIREEQKNICLICGKELEDHRITIHHINYIKRDDSRKNVMMVHNGCNSKVNFNREFWEIKLTYLNENIIKDNGVIIDEN